MRFPPFIFSDETRSPLTQATTGETTASSASGGDEDASRNKTKTKHLASIMMLGIVASNGVKMPPVFWPEGYRLNAADYIEILKTKVIPWIKREFMDRSVVFQQDVAPALTSKAVQNYLASAAPFWPKNFWPPSSPDLDPLD